MKVSEAFPSKYLKADDLDGEDLPVVIKKISREEVGEEKQLRMILYFNDQKPMVCNKTNAKRIELLHGDETDDWIGKQIVLTAEWVPFKGDTVEALRVKPPGKTTKRKHVVEDRGTHKLSSTAPAEEGLEDEIPFDPPAKPSDISFEQMARNAASSGGYEQVNNLYKAPTTTMEQKRWLTLHKLELETLYPRSSTTATRGL